LITPNHQEVAVHLLRTYHVVEPISEVAGPIYVITRLVVVSRAAVERSRSIGLVRARVLAPVTLSDGPWTRGLIPACFYAGAGQQR